MKNARPELGYLLLLLPVTNVTKVTKNGVDELQKALPKCMILHNAQGGSVIVATL